MSDCEHGGRCRLLPGHVMPHDSRYCQWDDAHAFTRVEADAILAQDPEGRLFLDTLGLAGLIMEGMEDEDW